MDEQIDQWMVNATPGQLMTAGRKILSKIATQDQGTRDRFVESIRRDQNVAKLMQHPLESAGR